MEQACPAQRMCYRPAGLDSSGLKSCLRLNILRETVAESLKSPDVCTVAQPKIFRAEFRASNT
jgi:hypothetical protein